MAIKPEQMDELKRIAARLADQDGRATRDPFFVVFEKEEIPTSDDYSTQYKYHDTAN